MAKVTRWAMFLRAFFSVLLAGSAGVRGASADEAADWAQAQQLRTADAYFQYLRRNPAGQHIDEAVQALNALGALGSPNSDRSRGVKLY